MERKRSFKCKSEAQKWAIRISYAKRAVSPSSFKTVADCSTNKYGFPKKFPFWARLKIGKNRTTLVIDDCETKDKQHGNSLVKGYVHREAIHTKNKNYEEVYPNPDKTDKRPMYLKRPRKLPKRLFKPHNKKLDMPEYLRKRYEKNNKK